MSKKIVAKVAGAVTLLCLLAAFAGTFFLKPFAIQRTSDELNVYASSYPVYTISQMIIDDVPGIHLTQLTQPQLAGYTDYSLSDWETALLAQADVFVQMGFGFEGFSEQTASGKSAVITLLSLLELETAPEGCAMLNFTQTDPEEEKGDSPWLYMSIDGMLELLEVMCGSIAYLDQQYSVEYYLHLDAAYEKIIPVKKRLDKFHALDEKKVAVAHDALIYTAHDLDAEIALYIKRETAQSLDEKQINRCIEEMQHRGIHILLIEDAADQMMTARFEEAGITVIRQQLMLDMTPTFSVQGYIDAFHQNLDTIEGALIN